MKPNKPISLTVHRNTRERHARHRVADDLTRSVKIVTGDKSMDGWVLMAYRKELLPSGGFELKTRTLFSMRDTMDAPHLPDLAHGEITKVISE